MGFVFRAFFLVLVFGVLSPAAHAQQSPATPSQASASSKAAAAPPSAAQQSAASTQGSVAEPAADPDTLDTIPPTDETEDGSNPDHSQPLVVVAPRLKDDSSDDAPVLKPVPANAGGNAARQQINDQCANLLFLAMTLKTEVDKTTVNELSVPVVRSADQIESLARKLRGEMKPVLSSSR